MARYNIGGASLVRIRLFIIVTILCIGLGGNALGKQFRRDSEKGGI